MKFKVGDKVRVREDLEVDKDYGYYKVVEDMKKYEGEEFIIDEVRRNYYRLKDEIAKVEPELASCMVRECVYRGFCPEMFSCGYSKTEEFQKELKAYRGE